MRYLNWDVLLFPQEGTDIKTPLQEFKTKCDIVQDSEGDSYSNISNTAYYNAVTRGLPTVSCYVPSLAYKSSFRVSLHCWAPPEATKATMSLESKDDQVVFEAKVLIDGECTAGLIFRADAHWPQIIDNTAPTKGGKPGSLRFPAFHQEMLSQTWFLPHQSMGRIKVVVAEGVSHGPPGTTPFEKTRNLVAFSFQHTPLHILEDSGIAWPNPGMFYQIAYPDFNPLSPRKAKSADPDAHAHSPRRGCTANVTNVSAKHEGIAAPQSLSNGVMLSGMAMPPPPFKAHRYQAGDPFLSQVHHHDSFGGISEPLAGHRFCQDNTRQISNSGDVSMYDIQPRSTASDEIMAEYSRGLSPTSTSFAHPFTLFSQPLSPENYHNLPLLASAVSKSQTPSQNRLVFMESLRGPRMQRLFDDLEAQSERESQLPESSQFREMLDAMSPRKTSESGYYPPNNARVSSAANTPPPVTRPSATAEGRALSYVEKNHSVSHTASQLSTFNHTQTFAEAAAKPRNRPCRTRSRCSERFDKGSRDLLKIAKNPRSTTLESRNADQTSDLGFEEASTLQRTASAGSVLVQEKESNITPHPSGGDSKRRRVSSHNNPQANLSTQETTTESSSKYPTNTETQTNSPDGINEIDEFTPDGVVTRVPLRDLSNRM